MYYIIKFDNVQNETIPVSISPIKEDDINDSGIIYPSEVSASFSRNLKQGEDVYVVYNIYNEDKFNVKIFDKEEKAIEYCKDKGFNDEFYDYVNLIVE